MSNEEIQKNHSVTLVKILIGSLVGYYVLLNIVFNYLSLALQSLKTEVTYGFQIKYLFKNSMFDFSIVFICAALFACLTIWKYHQNWQIKNGNKNIKGEAHFLELNEIEKILYGVDEDDIESAEKSGIPLYRENGRIYMDSETIHSLVIGTTRSGKGQTFVMPMIRYICHSQSKHSMVINDPKGEMLENCYDMLIKNGYEVVVLNLRDTQWSNLWNPLQIIIDEYRDRREKKNGNDDLSRCIKLCQSLANVFTHNEKSDPIWPESAKSLFVAMLLYLLEQGYDNGHLENVSLYSLYQLFIEFGTQNEARKVNGANRDLNALDELFNALPIGNPARSAYATSNFASGDMRSSIFSTLASNLTLFGSDVGVSKLTSGNQINFRSLADPDKPMALFMLVPDGDTSRYVLSSLFVNQCYDELVEYANNFIGQKLPQRVHFILDEFGNMVHIPAMDTKITVGAGRNLLFDLFIQDLNQLDSNYSEAAKTIRSNCGNIIYINSLDKDTNEYFSAILGNKTIEYNTYSGDLNTWLSHQSGTVDSQPLITADKLSNLPAGTAITKRQRCYPMKTQFDFFYKLGIKPQAVKDVSEKMELIDRPLSETIYPLDEIWATLIKRTAVGEDADRQAYHWKNAVDKLLMMKNEDGTQKWIWQIESLEDGITDYKLVLRKPQAVTLKTDFAPEVEANNGLENILNRIKDRDIGVFNEITEAITQLHEPTTENKSELAKKAIMACRSQRYLSAEEKQKIEKAVNDLHNGG